jgi:hypothetical protein
MDTTGRIRGKLFPRDPIDINYADSYYRWPDEKQSAIKTSILRNYPFPNWPGEYVVEGISWARMGMFYRTRFTNRPVRVYERSSDEAHTHLYARPGSRSRAWFYTIMLVTGLKYCWHPRYWMLLPLLGRDLARLMLNN